MRKSTIACFALILLSVAPAHAQSQGNSRVYAPDYVIWVLWVNFSCLFWTVGLDRNRTLSVPSILGTTPP